MKERIIGLSDFILHNVLWFVNGFLIIYVTLPLLAPILMRLGLNDLAALIYLLYRPFCHQRPSHSFFILGYQVAFCARCTGIYTTLLASGIFVAVYPLNRTLVKFSTLIIMILPMALDGTLSFIFELYAYVTNTPQIFTSSNPMRLVTGWLFAFGIGLFLFTRIKESLRAASFDLSKKVS